jgi:small redox-active disulfide protein 2
MLEVKILGTGCSSCRKLERLTMKAIDELGIPAFVEKVEDIQKIMTYDILRTPGLVVNGKLLISGEVPKLEKLKEILSQNL